MGLRVVQISYALGIVADDAVGGAEQVLATLDAGLADAGHDSAIVAPVGSRAARALFAAGEVPAHVDRASWTAAGAAHWGAVRRAIGAAHTDVVHLHGIDFADAIPSGAPPAVATLHLPPSWYPRHALVRRPDVALVCVSEAQARELPAGAPLTAVVPNGIRLDAFRPAAKERFALVVARICPEKAIHVALDAARDSGTPLQVVGAVFGYPEHVRYFEDQVRPRLDRDRRFVGPLGGAEKARALAAATCVVIPSVAPETSSLVAMEALASGTPVVARRVGALPEIVDDGRTGFLVDGDADLRDAIPEAARLSPEECRRAAEDRFDAREMVRRYLAVYARVIRQAGRRAVGAIRRRSTATPTPTSTPTATPTRTATVPRAGPPLAVSELDGLAALEALEPEWRDLAERDPGATPFQRPEWLLPYCRAFGVSAPWAVAVRRRGRLAALAPMVLFDDGGRRTAALLGSGVSDWQDALVDPELATDGAALLFGRLADRRDRYDRLVLERLPAGSAFAQLRVPGLEAEELAPDDPCPVLPLPSSPERLEPASRLLESVRYGRRRLARLGDVRVVAAGPDRLEPQLEALFSLHGARWGARGQAGVLGDVRIRGFHREAARALLAAGILRSYLLTVAGRPAAAYHGFVWRRRAAYYVGGFDPVFRAASPGSIVVAHAVEEAIREGAAELDFLRGREAYKYAWGARDRAAVRRSFAARPRG